MRKRQGSFLADHRRKAIATRLERAKQMHFDALRQLPAGVPVTDVRRNVKRCNARRKQPVRRETTREVAIRAKQPVINGRWYWHIGSECVSSGLPMDQIGKTTKGGGSDDPKQLRVVNLIAFSDHERLA